MKKLLMFVGVMSFLAAGPAAEAARAIPAYPQWRDHRILPQTGGEATPFVFGGRRYRLENVPYFSIADKPVAFNYHEDHCRIRDLATGLVLSYPMVNHYFSTAFVHDGTAYVFGADYGTNGWYRAKSIDVSVSKDLVSWTAPVPVLRAEDECLFNNSVASDGKRFYMCYESNDARYPVFTFKFAVSDDLLRWSRIPDAIYAQDKYGGGPALYYLAPWFYLTYVNEVAGQGPGGCASYDTRIARTKDFIHWEEPPGVRPVLAPDFTREIDHARHPGVMEINASDAEFEEEDGQVRADWCGGNQQGLGDLQTAVCAGTLRGLFESFFRPAAPFMAIRLWSPHHEDPVLAQRTFDALVKYRAACDEVWFGIWDGYPSLSDREASARLMRPWAEAYRKAGIVPSLQGCTLNHCDNFYPLDLSQKTWSGMVGEDGTEAKVSSCPRRPAFLAYVRAEYAVAAAVHPYSVWLDDDLRMFSHAPVRLACFCDGCLADFAKLTGVKRTRAELNAARKADPAVAKAWDEFSRASLGVAARAAAEGVHSVSPETRMALQNGGDTTFGGSDKTGILRPMHEVTGLPLGYRAGGGFYEEDDNPRGMFLKAYDNANQWAALPDYVDRRVPEIEGFPHVSGGKTGRGLALESFADLALGANGLSYAINCSGQETVDWYAEHLLKPLAAWRPFLEGFARHVEGTVPGGIRPSAGNWYELAFIGFPVVADGATKGVFCEAFTDVSGLPDDAVRARLATGVLMGGSAAMNLAKRGFGDLLGAAPSVRTNTYLRETMADGGVWSVMLVSWPLVQFAPRTPVRVLGRAEDGAVVSLAATNRLGGRMALFGAAGPDSFVKILSTGRRKQLLDAFDWASGGKLPVLVETPCKAFVLPRVTDAGALRAVAVINASIGAGDPLAMRLRGVDSARQTAVWHTPEAADAVLPLRREGADACLTLPPIEGWRCGWLEL